MIYIVLLATAGESMEHSAPLVHALLGREDRMCRA